MKRNVLYLTVLVALGLNSPGAYAYLDPGSGSLIIQGIIGAIAAAAVTLKLYWHKIKLKFGGRKRPPDSNNSEAPSKEEK